MRSDAIHIEIWPLGDPELAEYSSCADTNLMNGFRSIYLPRMDLMSDQVVMGARVTTKHRCCSVRAVVGYSELLT